MANESLKIAELKKQLEESRQEVSRRDAEIAIIKNNSGWPDKSLQYPRNVFYGWREDTRNIQCTGTRYCCF
jgi:hypothetical protein